jgi:hypothetical protein
MCATIRFGDESSVKIIPSLRDGSFLDTIQALRTWLLSFCPYGTGYYRSVPAGQIQPTRRDKIRLDICLQNRLHRSRIYIRELRFLRETKLGDTIGLVRANPWLADNPLSVKFFPEVVP